MERAGKSIRLATLPCRQSSSERTDWMIALWRLRPLRCARYVGHRPKVDLRTGEQKTQEDREQRMVAAERPARPLLRDEFAAAFRH